MVAAGIYLVARLFPVFLAAPVTLTVLGVIACIAMVVSYVPTLWFYKRSALWALALPVTGTLYLLMTISSAVRYWRGAGSVWKGRAYDRLGTSS